MPHTGTTPQTVLFPDLFTTPVVATFDQQHASSDGGAVLLKAAEMQYGVIEGFARCLLDDRQPGTVRHALGDLLGQRIFGIACGHPDANDADRRADDPIHKLVLGRDPVDGAPLATQPTISRFENHVGVQELYAMGCELAASVIERHQRRRHGRARRITIDLDPTEDPTHGAQQLTFFNGHYDSWCDLPLLAFLTFDHETEQYLCAAILRPGNAPATRGAIGTLRRLLALLRIAFPTARFLVRLDGGFATPDLFDFLDAEPGLDDVVAMGANAVLTRYAEAAMGEVRTQSEASGHTEHVYTDARYAARTWGRKRRVIIKAEVVRLDGREPRDNPRCVITNLRQTPRFVYERVYCARGDIEESDQGTPRRAPDRPDKLLSLLGQSIACAPHGRSLRAPARTAAAGRWHRVCARPGDVAARAAAQTGGPRRCLGAPHRPPSPDGDPRPRRLAAHRPHAWRPSWLTQRSLATLALALPPHSRAVCAAVSPARCRRTQPPCPSGSRSHASNGTCTLRSSGQTSKSTPS